jgi:hypothetical protein
LSTVGASGTASSRQNGRSASTIDWTAYSCSARFFSDASSSVASSALAMPSCGHVVPASTRALTWLPCRLTSSSGVAPTSPSTANAQHVGYLAASPRSRNLGSTGRCASATRSWASTTLASRPDRSRSTAPATELRHDVTGSCPVA